MACRDLRESGSQAHFVAVRLPHAVQADEADAQVALAFIEPDRSISFNIERAVEGFEREFAESLGETMMDFTKGNVKARARMIAQYAIAGQLSYLVVGTDHAAEAVTGFFTKHGDGGADVTPLSGLTKRQGAELLKYLGAPERLYTKPPTADLLDGKPGQTDEIELGMSYAEIDDYLEGKSVDERVAAAIESMYLRTRHKRRVPVSPSADWLA
jgi:NAD+ synthase